MRGQTQTLKTNISGNTNFTHVGAAAVPLGAHRVAVRENITNFGYDLCADAADEAAKVLVFLVNALRLQWSALGAAMSST